MSDKKIVVVFGATGAQGGSVVDSLLADGKYKVRGLTRNPESEKGKKLTKKGVQVVKADNTNEEQIKEALKGAYAAFVVVNFWDKSSFGKEDVIGKKIVDIAKEQNVTHFMYSTLANVEKESNGKWDVPHFTQKARVEEYARTKGFKYTTFPAAAFYYTNFGPPFNMAKKSKEGVVEFIFPFKESVKLTTYDPCETGGSVVNALNNPDKFNGKVIAYPGTHAPITEYVDTFKKVTGVDAKYVYVDLEEYIKLFPLGGKELGHMLGWIGTNTYYGSADLEFGRNASKLTKWGEWLKKSKWRG